MCRKPAGPGVTRILTHAVTCFTVTMTWISIFILLNQTKLSISEIQQVWKAVKDMTRKRMRVCCSALEIARNAGWDDSVADIETRVRTALAALEQSGYLERGNNVPHVYATGITVKNMDEARKRITHRCCLVLTR